MRSHVDRIIELEAKLYRLQQRYNRLVADLAETWEEGPLESHIKYAGEEPCTADEFSQWAQAIGAKVECSRLTVHLTDSDVLPKIGLKVITRDGMAS